MQVHVERREHDLAQRRHAVLEVLGGQHAVEQRVRQRLAGLDVAGHAREHFPLPAEVLHELRGQLYRIPFHAVDARHAQLVHLREHVVQAVAEFVEEGDDLVVREQRRLVADRAGEVAGEVGHRGLHTGVGQHLAAAGVVHPGAAALAVTGVQVDVELRQQLALRRFDAEEAHVGVPHLGRLRADLHGEQRLHDVEQAVQHGRLREVLLHLLLGEGIAGFAQLFGGVGHVPRLELVDAQRGLGERL